MACSATMPHRFPCSLPMCKAAPERWHCDSEAAALPFEFEHAPHVVAIPVVLMVVRNHPASRPLRRGTLSRRWSVLCSSARVGPGRIRALRQLWKNILRRMHCFLQSPRAHNVSRPGGVRRHRDEDVDDNDEVQRSRPSNDTAIRQQQ